MPWNQVRFDQGARDGISVAEVDGISQAVMEHSRLRGDEYDMGFAKGVRRVMIDRGKHIECAAFILDTDVEFTLRVKIKTALDADEMRWALDPEVPKVVGLFRGSDCMMVFYLESADFEESLRLLEWADER